MYGATGEDAVVRVPVGTVVYQVYDEQRETEKVQCSVFVFLLFFLSSFLVLNTVFVVV